MIKLLLTINNLNTAGMKYVLADIVKNIDRQKFSPMIGVNKLSGSPLEKEMEGICPIIQLPLRVKRRPILKFPMALYNLSRQLKGMVDIAHSFDYSSDWTEAYAMKLAGVKFVAEKTNLIYKQKKWQKKLKAASHIICLSQEQKKQLAAYSAKVSCIPTGIDLERFAVAKPACRQKFNLKPEDIVLVSVAHLVDVKGYEELMEAMVPLITEFPELKILAVGEGKPDFEAQLMKKQTALNLQNNLIFIGRSDDVPALLKMADVKILATQNRGRREGFGAAIVEAMACGLPVLATRSGGPEDIVMDGETGWLVPGDGPQYLEEGLRRMLKDREQWKSFGEAGLRRAEAAYNLPLMVQRYEEVYLTVMEGKQKSLK